MSDKGKILLFQLKKRGPKNDVWFYACSFAQWAQDTVEDSSFKVKQGDWLRHADHLSDKVKRVDNQRGKYKASHIKNVLSSCQFYRLVLCRVG